MPAPARAATAVRIASPCTAKALEGRRLYTAYHTIAHEFHHIVQMERDQLPCNGTAEDKVPRYEREALAIADQLQPACK